MGSLTYTLCGKPVIGLIMFVSSLCVFPPLIDKAPIGLDGPGTVMRRFTVPVDKQYQLDLDVEASPARLAAAQDTLGEYDSYCDGGTPYDAIPEAARKRLGAPIPFHVIVRASENGTVVAERQFTSLCTIGRGREGESLTATRMIGRLPLQRGEYVLEIRNLAPQPGLAGIRAYVSLVSGHGK